VFWQNGEKRVTLEQADLQVMKLCMMPMEELLRENTSPYDIPPLWSVLSYVMLIGHGSPEGILREYRVVRAMAEHTAPYYHCVEIPKNKGGVRRLYVPHYSLREHQDRILSRILRQLPVDPHAYAYRRGISFRGCAQAHVGKAIVIHMDLKNFFGSIKENMVFTALQRDTEYGPALCRFFARLCCLHGSLPQGTSTSPALSNIVFRPCDEALAELAEGLGMAYTRYSDDLFFSGNADAGEVIGKVTALVESFGFHINKEKTRVRRQQDRQNVLGLTVNAGLQVNRTYRRKLEQALYYLERFGLDAEGMKKAESPLQYLQQLLGKVNYVLQIDPENQKYLGYRQQLEKKIGSYDPGYFWSWIIVDRLAAEIRRINKRFALRIDPEAIRVIYGAETVVRLAQHEADTIANIRHLIDLGFGELVTDICNRYGYILLDDYECFRWKLQDLIKSLGPNHVEIINNDMSVLEALF
jgi:hypothetical protein